MSFCPSDFPSTGIFRWLKMMLMLLGGFALFTSALFEKQVVLIVRSVIFMKFCFSRGQSSKAQTPIYLNLGNWIAVEFRHVDLLVWKHHTFHSNRAMGQKQNAVMVTHVYNLREGDGDEKGSRGQSRSLVKLK